MKCLESNLEKILQPATSEFHTAAPAEEAAVLEDSRSGGEAAGPPASEPAHRTLGRPDLCFFCFPVAFSKY